MWDKENVFCVEDEMVQVDKICVRVIYTYMPTAKRQLVLVNNKGMSWKGYLFRFDF